MPADFYRAQIPEDRFCLGFKLLPLRLGHLIILKRVGNAFVCSGSPDFADLATAVLICSNTYDDAIRHIKSKVLNVFMRNWHDRLTGLDSLSVRLFLRPARPLNLDHESAEFISYLTENTEPPNFCYDPEKCKELECPSEASMKVFLMLKCGMSESEAMNYPWALGLWLQLVSRASEGKIDLVTEESINNARSIGEKLDEMLKSGRLNRG